jgi:hypothetical protein
VRTGGSPLTSGRVSKRSSNGSLSFQTRSSSRPSTAIGSSTRIASTVAGRWVAGSQGAAVAGVAKLAGAEARASRHAAAARRVAGRGAAGRRDRPEWIRRRLSFGFRRVRAACAAREAY